MIYTFWAFVMLDDVSQINLEFCAEFSGKKVLRNSRRTFVFPTLLDAYMDAVP